MTLLRNETWLWFEARFLLLLGSPLYVCDGIDELRLPSERILILLLILSWRNIVEIVVTGLPLPLRSLKEASFSIHLLVKSLRCG